jgi:CBS domain-containing protein
MRRVREQMERDLLTLSPEMRVPDALRLLEGRGLAGAPVLDRGRVVGAFWAEDAPAADAAEALVRDHVRHGSHGVPPDADLRSVITRMRRAGDQWLPVVDQGRLLGILFLHLQP